MSLLRGCGIKPKGPATVRSASPSTGTNASLKGNRADGNGFAGGFSDLLGLGIEVTSFTIAPHGTNAAYGDDNFEECDPFYLC